MTSSVLWPKYAEERFTLVLTPLTPFEPFTPRFGLWFPLRTLDVADRWETGREDPLERTTESSFDGEAASLSLNMVSRAPLLRLRGEVLPSPPEEEGSPSAAYSSGPSEASRRRRPSIDPAAEPALERAVVGAAEESIFADDVAAALAAERGLRAGVDRGTLAEVDVLAEAEVCCGWEGWEESSEAAAWEREEEDESRSAPPR